MQHPFCIGGLEPTDKTFAALQADGIVSPTAIQQAAIPAILTGQDVVVQSGTGTGKTLAYLLPLLQRARLDQSFRVVVLAPTPDLAVQILRAVECYADDGVGHVGLIGGGNTERQKDRLKKHPQIMVGTPGRVIEFIFARKVKTAQISAWVLDETDEILSPQNGASLSEICSRPEFSAQIICASATFGLSAQNYAERFMKPDRLLTHVTDAPLNDHIEHVTIPFDPQRKDIALLALLKRHRIKQTLIFVNKLQHVGHLYRFFASQGVPCLGLSSERDKRCRQQAIAALKTGEVHVLVATDAAARGLDIKGMRWVIHYEPARDAQTYLHRAGRVGRAGQSGVSVVFASPQERGLLRKYSHAFNITFGRLGGDAAVTPLKNACSS